MLQHKLRDTASHRDLFEDYMSCHVTVCSEPGPCKNEDLLDRAAHALLQQPVPRGSATLVRLLPLVMERILNADLTHLFGLVRATELLETLCLNLCLQPWRREFRSLKTFTGVFVYCLKPALSSKTLRCVLADIGYLPLEAGPSPSEYRLCEEPSQDRALRVAFELLLTRALCLHLLQRETPVQEWAETLKSKLLPQCSENTSDNKTEEEEEREEQAPQASQIEPELPKDQSIFPLHVTYPDLVFRGRPLLQDRDSAPSQLRHRRHAQRLRVPPAAQGPAHTDCPGYEGLSGPVSLSLHLTLKPHVSEPLQGPETDGLCEKKSQERSESEEPEELLITEETKALTLDQPSSDSDDDSLGTFFCSSHSL